MASPPPAWNAAIDDPFVRWVVRNLFMPDVPVWFVATYVLSRRAAVPAGLTRRRVVVVGVGGWFGPLPSQVSVAA